MTIAVVLDSNPIELQQTVNRLEESGVFTEIDPFADVLKAVEYIELKKCDVVFTEIEMNRMNGFDFMRMLVNRHPEIFLVFVTNKSNYALQAFEYGAEDFIVKPIGDDDIDRLMKKLQKRKKI